MQYNYFHYNTIIVSQKLRCS